MAEMAKRERLEATIRGEETDRPPVALWRHWPGDDRRAEDIARAQVAFQRRYDFDFIKVTPSSSYCVEDWGSVDEYVGSTDGTCEYRSYAIDTPDDWGRLQVLSPKAGALGRQLRCLEGIHDGVGDSVPFIQTIFNPLSMAKNLAGQEKMLVHMRQSPDAFRQGLETIAETTIRFVREVMRTGAAGVFFAVQHAQYGVLSEQEYAEFAQPLDLRLLKAAEGAWLNLLHLHGNDVMFDLLASYPAQVINWHDQETPPSLAQALGLFPGAVCGGLRQWETMVRGTPEDVRSEAQRALEQTGGRRFILGTGCVTPIVAPTSNIRAARDAVEL